MFNNRGPKPEYWGNEYYRSLVEKNYAILDAPQSRTNQILAQSSGLSLLGGIADGTTAAFRVSVFLLFPAVIASFKVGLWPIVSVVGAIGLAWSISFLARRRYGLKTREALSAHGDELKSLSERAARATGDIISAWETYNVDFAGYPPDWEERRRNVRKRDNYQCVACGWPRDSRRRARNLHTHHIVPLSRGGRNALENLTTLCHVCHRKQAGPGHEQVRYAPRKASYKKFRRSPWS